MRRVMLPVPVVAAAAAACALMGFVAARASRRSAPSKAFILLVEATFASLEDRDKAIRDWRPVAAHCERSEPGTLSYEMAISDSNPNHVVFVERYADKDDAYLKVHKSSDAFLTFRKKLAAINPDITGHSYIATDIGYFAR